MLPANQFPISFTHYITNVDIYNNNILLICRIRECHDVISQITAYLFLFQVIRLQNQIFCSRILAIHWYY